MNTPYSDIFEAYLNKISDPLYAKLSAEDAEADMLKLMKTAIFFFEYPRLDLNDRDDTAKSFNIQLGFDEIEILSHLMVLEWYKRKVSDTDILVQKFTDKEFKITSQANHLDSLVNAKKQKEEECRKMLVKYSYRTKDNQPKFHELVGEGD